MTIPLPPLPQAVGWAGHLFDGGPKEEIYTGKQMQAYAKQTQRLALEAAAVACERHYDKSRVDFTRDPYITTLQCAALCRKMIEEIE